MRRGYFSEVPPSRWEEGMLCGNGTLGALIMGHPVEEEIYLTHERLFAPLHEPILPVETAKSLTVIRDLLENGEFQSAANLVVEQSKAEGYGEKRWTDGFFPACSIRLFLDACEEDKTYFRSLNYETGVSTVKVNDIKREVFVSRADQVAVIKLSSDTHFQCKVLLSPSTEAGQEIEYFKSIGYQRNRLPYVYEAKDEGVSILGRFMDHQLTYKGELNLVSCDGVHTITHPIADEPAFISFSDCKEITLICELVPVEIWKKDVTVKTTCKKLLDYNALLENHLAIHSTIYNRTELYLGNSELENLSTEALWKLNSQQGHPDLYLFKKVFDAGRYAILSSSGETPPNLQGIWTATSDTAWSSDYTQNGNLQTAIWGNLAGNMPECMESYINYIEELIPDSEVNAKQLYDCNGVLLASRTNNHGLLNHFDEIWPMTFWTAGAAWTAKYFYEEWLYSGNDAIFLNHALPYMKKVVEFYEDFLIEDKMGYYMFSPSYSPENHAANTNSQACVNATMDIAAAKSLLSDLIIGCTTLDIEEANIVKWERMLEKLPPYLINHDGALSEWADPRLEDRYDHRHASHLYPLFFGVAKEFKEDDTLLCAIKKAYEMRVNLRIQEMGTMAFGLISIGMVAAHLKDKKTVSYILNYLAKNNYYSNFASSHDAGPSIFNTDISGGLPALIMECLLQSEPIMVDHKIIAYQLTLLPVLPDGWDEGKIVGMRARGGFIVDITWSQRAVISFNVKNPYHQKYIIEQ